MARPKIEIDQHQFEQLCKLQCTQQEIADFFSCSVDTIERWCKRTYHMGYAEIYNKKASVGKISLRRTQWKQAENSSRMSIWLGKQYLGQTDKIENTITEIDAETRQAVNDFLNDDGQDDDGGTEGNT